MITIKLIYKEDLEIVDINDILDSLKEKYTLNIEKYHLDKTTKKESSYARKTLVEFGTSQTPFMLFMNGLKKEYAVLYNESKNFSFEKINNIIKEGYEKNLRG